MSSEADVARLLRGLELEAEVEGREWMRRWLEDYKAVARRGWPIGSGAVESACRRAPIPAQATRPILDALRTTTLGRVGRSARQRSLERTSAHGLMVVVSGCARWGRSNHFFVAMVAAIRSKSRSVGLCAGVSQVTLPVFGSFQW